MNEYIASGLPISRELGIYPTSNLPVQYLGRGSDGRTDVLLNTDLQVAHDFRFGDKGLRFDFTVFNLLDQDAAISAFSTYQAVNGVVPERVPVLHGPADARVAHRDAERPPRSAVPAGERLPGADLGALRSPLHVLRSDVSS